MDILSVLTFIHHYANVMDYLSQLLQSVELGSPFCTHLLPKTRRLSMVSERSVNGVPVGYRSFRNMWRSCLPWIRFMTPWTDECYRCKLHRLEVKNAHNESEKRENLRRFSDHLEAAKLEHDFYEKPLLQRART